MNHVRLHGDPLADDAAASRMRSFLRLALANGLRCAWSLDGLRPDGAASDAPKVTLQDCDRVVSVPTRLPPAEVELLQRALDEAAPATAPVLVFAEADERATVVAEAGLVWPQAAAVVAVGDGATANELLDRARAELRWAGLDNPPLAREARELQPWLALSPATVAGPIVCFARDGFADGCDLAIAAWRRLRRTHAVPLRVVATTAMPPVIEAIWRALGDDLVHAEVLVAEPEPEHVRDAIAIALPWRRLVDARSLVHALASGRPVCAARFAATAPLLAHGACFPVGGQHVAGDAPGDVGFEPDADGLLAALRAAVGDCARAQAIACRARAFVAAELTRNRPAPPPPPVAPAIAPPPTIAVEAAWGQDGAATERAIALVRALAARADVIVRCVNTGRSRLDLRALRAAAPEVAARLCRDAGDVDLWLAAAAAPRAARPRCRAFAVVGATAHAHSADFAPLLTQECDVAVAAGIGVGDALLAAGRSPDAIVAWTEPAAVAAALAACASHAAAARAGLPTVALARAIATPRATVLT
ncbi:MAG: hypothetical protein ACK5S5_07685 [Planctomycetota bacterium]|jgi:hypothetical protein